MNRAGFVTTLEAILAATIFLIFLVNVLPDFVGTNPQADVLERQANHVLSALDRAGDLRADATARNLTAIEESISSYMAGVNIAVGLSWVNRTDGQFTGGTLARNFTVDKSQIERERLLVWLESGSGLEVDINGQQAVSTDSTGVSTVSISELTVDGQNNISLSGTGLQAHYTIEQYYYEQSQELPSTDSIYGTGYMIGTNSTANEPQEIQVYIWR